MNTPVVARLHVPGDGDASPVEDDGFNVAKNSFREPDGVELDESVRESCSIKRPWRRGDCNPSMLRTTVLLARVPKLW